MNFFSLLCDSPGDGVLVVENDNLDQVYKGKVVLVQRNYFLLKFQKDFDECATSAGYQIQFAYNRSLFMRKHEAIDLAITKFDETFLFPTTFTPTENSALKVELVGKKMHLDGTEVEWFHETLNFQQMRAVVSALRQETHLPYIVHGPPGNNLE